MEARWHKHQMTPSAMARMARWKGYSEDANPYDPEIEPGDYRRWDAGWRCADNDLDDADDD
jgi:hypothetical protein